MQHTSAHNDWHRRHSITGPVAFSDVKPRKLWPQLQLSQTAMSYTLKHASSTSVEMLCTNTVGGATMPLWVTDSDRQCHDLSVQRGSKQETMVDHLTRGHRGQLTDEWGTFWIQTPSVYPFAFKWPHCLQKPPFFFSFSTRILNLCSLIKNCEVKRHFSELQYNKTLWFTHLLCFS